MRGATAGLNRVALVCLSIRGKFRGYEESTSWTRMILWAAWLSHCGAALTEMYGVWRERDPEFCSEFLNELRGCTNDRRLHCDRVVGERSYEHGLQSPA